MQKAYVYAVSLILALAGLAYLFSPAQFTDSAYSVNNAPLLNLIRSTGGLYLALVLFVVLSLKLDNIRLAILGLIFVLSGLMFGRVVSIIADGIPNARLILSFAVEILAALAGLLLIRKQDRE